MTNKQMANKSNSPVRQKNINGDFVSSKVNQA